MGRIKTSKRSYDLPDLDEAANVPKDLKTFADQVDADMGVLFADKANVLPGLQAATATSSVSVPLINGWAAVSGYGLTLARIGKLRVLSGMVQGNGTTAFAKVDSADCPAGNVWLAPAVNSGGASWALQLNSDGNLSFPSTYRTSTPGSALVHPVFGVWIAR